MHAGKQLGRKLRTRCLEGCGQVSELGSCAQAGTVVEEGPSRHHDATTAATTAAGSGEDYLF